MRKVVAGLLIGAASAALILGLDASLTALLGSPDRNPFRPSSSRPTTGGCGRRRSAAARSDIALVEIDEYSLRNLEPLTGRWPWPRVIHSMIIDFPRAVRRR